MKLTTIIIIIFLMLLEVIYAKQDTLPANTTYLDYNSKTTELYFDFLRTFNSDFLMTYRPGFKIADKEIGINGGLLNSKIAIGTSVYLPLINQKEHERFGVTTTEGLEATVGFTITSGKTEIYIIPGVSYRIHIFEWIGSYMIASPGLQVWLGTTNYLAIALSIGVGL